MDFRFPGNNVSIETDCSSHLNAIRIRLFKIVVAFVKEEAKLHQAFFRNFMLLQKAVFGKQK